MGKKIQLETRKATILGAVEGARSVAEELRDELQDWLDNLPENLQDGQKGQDLQEAIDYLEEGISALEDAEESEVQALLDYEIEYQYKPLSPSARRHMSRAKRLSEATVALNFIPTEVPEDLKIPEDDQDDAEELLNKVQEGLDALNNVSFPGMY